MNTQYRKNLKAIATACKNYTDEQIKKVYYDIGHNEITTDDHIDEATYQITAPAGAKLLQLMSVGGNAVKYNPSVASDDTTALVKTMPSTVYTFDGSKFYGASEVSENLAPTPVWVGGYHTTSGTYWGNLSNGIRNTTKMYLKPSSQYTISYKMNLGNSTLTRNLVFVCQYTNDGTFIERTSATIVQSNVNGLNVVNFTSSANVGYVEFSNYVEGVSGDYTALFDGAITEFMLNSGSTALPYSPYYSGIHNLELSGLKAEGQNLFDKTAVILDKILNATTGIISNDNNSFVSDYVEVIEGATYNYNLGVQFGTAFYDRNKTYLSGSAYTTTFTIPSGAKYIRMSAYKTRLDTLMISKGSTIPTTYTPYETPTTKTIDLSTILYNGSPLFEDNSLKAVGTAKDYITPYVAHKQMGYIDLGTLTPTYDNINYKFNYKGIPNAKIGVNSTASNILMANYDTKSIDYITANLNEDMLIGYSGGNILSVRNLSYTDPTTFKSAMNGVYLVYELATPIEVSIDWSATLRHIQGYSNGSITAQNTHNMDVESVITYNSIIQETLCGSVTITRNGVDILTRNLPTQASDGWSAGTQRNYRVFCDDEGNEVSKRETNVDKNSNMGAFTWTPNAITPNAFDSSNIATIVKKPAYGNVKANVLCAIYSTETSSGLAQVDKGCAIGTGGTLYAHDTAYDNATTFKTAMANEPLYYELADAIKTETSIDDIDYYFDVEEGDVITFNNPYAQQVYATYSFLIKEAKSNE